MTGKTKWGTMQKRTVGAVIGAAVAGTCLALTMQGSAQATPVAPVAEKAAVSKGEAVAPKAAASAVGRAAARAAVHARAACPSVGHAVGALTDNLSLGGVFSEPARIASGVSSATAFDR